MNFPFHVIGVMSGTSLDGLDVALVRFGMAKGQYSFELLKSKTFEYPKDMERSLLKCRELSNDELIHLHNNWGDFVGKLIKNEFPNSGIQVDLIASHGHTVFHEPDKGITLQIGSLERIHEITKITTVGDFRSLDVSKGGEGAPLVPIGDRLLFGEYTSCLNLGGIANVSFESEGSRIAFDVAPCNLVLNYLAARLGKRYDENGALARTGKLNRDLLERLNEVPLYHLEQKPSLGIEYIEKVFYPLFDGERIPVVDQLHTYCVHLAIQLSKLLPEGKVLVTGGGAYHRFLIEQMRGLGMDVILPSSDIIDFKEALIFAFLGLRKMEGEVNVLSSVTKSKTDSCAGQLFL